MTRPLLVTGAGGVGKTTIAAALAVAASRSGRETLVLTVDPARRLAQALGLDHLGNDPQAVPGAPRLAAAMLDVTASWEAIITRHAPPDVADRLKVNPYFRAIADRFPAAQAYAAGEMMTAHLESQRWEVLVIDTPPAGGGIDFFLAPRRMRDFVGGRLLRWLTGAGIPGRRTLFRITGRPVLRFADAVLGGPLLEDVAGFLFDLRAIHDGLTARARTIEGHFGRAATLVITTADPTPLREARRFFRELPDVAGRPEAIVFNRCLPVSWATPVPPCSGADGRLEALLEANLARWGAEARRQHEAQRDFAAHYRTALATLPWIPDAPTTLDGLAGLLAAGSGIPYAAIGMPEPA